MRRRWKGIYLANNYLMAEERRSGGAGVIKIELLNLSISQFLNRPISQFPPPRYNQRSMMQSSFWQRTGRWLPWGIGAGFLLLYGRTLWPSAAPADNGEFQLVAVKLGLAHPPGFPLYTLLAHAFTWLPLPLTAVDKANFFAACTSALTLILVYAATFRLSQSRWAASAAAVALGTSTTFWAQATVANIRSLTTLFTAAALLALIHLHHATQPTQRGRALLAFTLALGFGLTHHLSLAFMGLGLGVWALWEEPTLWRQPHRWPPLLAAVASALLPLLYLPWRDPALRSWAAFSHYALALGFQGDFFYFNTADLLALRLRVMANILLFQFQPLLLAGMALGMARLVWQRPRLGLLLGGSAAVHIFIVATYRAPQAVEYLLPAYVPLVVALGGLAGAKEPSRWQVAPWALLLAVALSQGWRHYPSYAWLSAQNDTHAYTQTFLDGTPPNGVILADWHWATPLWVAQQVAGQRPDVTVEFVYPQTADYGADWAARVAYYLAQQRPVAVTHITPAYATLPPSQPLGEGRLFPVAPLTAVPTGFTPLDVRLGDAAHLRGYQLAKSSTAVGEEVVLTVAWLPLANPPSTLFAHLVGFDGRVNAQDDQPAIAQPTGLTLTQFRLTPLAHAALGEYALLVGGTAAGQPLLNGAGEPRTALQNVAITGSQWRPYTAHPFWRPLAADPTRILIGGDWDNSFPTPRLYLHWRTPQGFVSEALDLPDGRYTLPATTGAWGWLAAAELTNDGGFYVPLGQGIVWTGGTAVEQAAMVPNSQHQLTQTFHATRPILRDVGVAVRLIGFEADGFTWAWLNPDPDMDIPALGAMPTLKWVAGSTVYHPRWFTVPPEAQVGQAVGGSVQLYDVFTNRPLPILDERIMGSNQPWIRMVGGK